MVYRLERNGELLKRVVMIGNLDKNLYREKEVIVIEFEDLKGAEEAAKALNANIVYEEEIRKAA